MCIDYVWYLRQFQVRNDWILWDVKISTCWYSKTTGLIFMKFTGFNEWALRSLYTNFQSILNFFTNIGIFSFKGYKCVLWSYMYTEKLNKLSNFAYLAWKWVNFSLKFTQIHETYTLVYNSLELRCQMELTIIQHWNLNGYNSH